MITNIKDFKKLNEDFGPEEFHPIGTSVESVYDTIIEYDGDKLEELLEKLAAYFTSEAEMLTNMNALGIAKDLLSAKLKIQQRTGN